MQPELTFRALSHLPIVFLAVVFVVLSLVSMWKENRFGWPLRGIIWFTVAIVGSCALIALLTGYVQKARSSEKFDLGGVVVTWEPEVVIAKVFTDPVVQAKVRTQIIGHADWLALDRGTLPRQDAIVRAAKRTGLSEAHVTEFLRQVPSALVAIPGTVDLLYRLKVQGHSLFCLSNMHLASIDHLEKSYTFWEVFAGVVISCRLQLCKPEPAIYTYLLETYGLDEVDTVFIDDTEANLSAAAQFGIHTIKFESPAQCESQLQALGCI